MYWDEWIKAGAFVVLVAMGFGFHYLSTLDTSTPARGVAALAPRTDVPSPAAVQAAPAAPAPTEHEAAQTTPEAPTQVADAGAPANPAAAPAPVPAEPTPVGADDAGTNAAAAPTEAQPSIAGNTSPPLASAPPAAWPALMMPAPAANPAPATNEAPQPAVAPAAEPTQQAMLTPPPAEIEAPVEQSSADAMMALRAAARTDDARAQYALALAYKMGRGVPADPAQSLLWLRRSAQNGLAVAARSLGIAYEEGMGVEKDPAEAAKWYTRAALAGDLQAMHNLAFFFTQGLGGLPRDGRQAAHWFRKAAERGLVASQVNLAILTSQGEQWGIEKKLSDAYFWSAIAADHGDPQATKMRDLIGKLFAPKEKADLDKKIAAFRPLPIDVIANGGFEIAPEAFLPKSLRPPLSAAEIATMRQQLKSLGYSGNASRDPVGAASEGLAPTDTASSAIDEKTELAIRAFQNDYGLPVTGAPDRNLIAALKAAPR